MQYLYDYSSGKIKQITDQNNFIYQTVFDGLDRILTEKKLDLVSPYAPVTNTSYTYTDTTGAVKVQRTDYLDGTVTADVHHYFDGLNRIIQERKEAEVTNTFNVKDTIYKSNGYVFKQSVPYTGTGSAKTSATSVSSPYMTKTYDPLGQILTIVDPTGTTTYGYDDWKTTVTDKNNKIKKYYNDAYGNLVKVDEMNGASTYTTNYEWSLNNKLIKITDALSNIRHFTYDGLDQRLTAEDLHASTDTTFGIWTYVYDDAGNVIQTISPNNLTTNYTYNDINQVLTEDYTGVVGTEISYIYGGCTNGVGKLCSITMLSGANTSYTYNSNGNVASEVKTINGTAYTTSYTYDRLGNIVTITYPDSAQVQYVYNTAGLLEKVQRKESGGTFIEVITNFDYSPTDQIATQNYVNGVITTNSYDSARLYRLSSKRTSSTYTPSSNTNPSITLTGANLINLNIGGRWIEPGYTATDTEDGTLTSFVTTAGSVNTAVAGTYQIVYSVQDSLGAPGARKIRTVIVNSLNTKPLVIGGGGKGTTRLGGGGDRSGGYKGNNFLYINPTISTTVKYVPPNTNPVITLTGTDFITLNVGGVWIDPGYSATDRESGNLTSSVTVTGLVNTSTAGTYQLVYAVIDPQGLSAARKIRTVVVKPVTVASVFLQNNSYTYDNFGNITQIVDASNTSSSKTANYTYDDLSRLTSATITAVAAGKSTYTHTFTYDALGNILTGPIGTYLYQGNIGVLKTNPHGVTSINGVTLTYDANGNLTGNGTLSNTWNYKDQLTQTVVGAVAINDYYDHNGDRVWHKVGAVNSYYPNKYYNYDGTKKTKSIYAGDTLIATIKTVGAVVTPYYTHTDHINSTTAVSDGAGSLVETLDYFPYGYQRISSGTHTEQRQYIGQIYDAATGLDYLNARYYKADIGRFISQDPSFLDIGAGGFEEKYERKLHQHLMNPQALNSYSYAHNNPITLSDPDGEIIPLLLAAWTVAEIGLSAYDVHSTADIISDPNASLKEKLTSGGLTLAGFALPGGGYGAAGKQASQVFNKTNSTGQALMKGVQNQKVLNLIGDNYRATKGRLIGSGSATEAMLHTLKTGRLVGESNHIDKLRQNVNRINNILKDRSINLNSAENNAIKNILRDSKNALRKLKK